MCTRHLFCSPFPFLYDEPFTNVLATRSAGTRRAKSQSGEKAREILALTQGVPASLYSSTNPCLFGLIRSIGQPIQQTDDTQCGIIVFKSIIAERGQPWARVKTGDDFRGTRAAMRIDLEAEQKLQTRSRAGARRPLDCCACLGVDSLPRPLCWGSHPTVGSKDTDHLFRQSFHCVYFPGFGPLILKHPDLLFSKVFVNINHLSGSYFQSLYCVRNIVSFIQEKSNDTSMDILPDYRRPLIIDHAHGKIFDRDSP